MLLILYEGRKTGRISLLESETLLVNEAICVKRADSIRLSVLDDAIYVDDESEALDKVFIIGNTKNEVDLLSLLSTVNIRGINNLESCIRYSRIPTSRYGIRKISNILGFVKNSAECILTSADNISRAMDYPIVLHNSGSSVYVKDKKNLVEVMKLTNKERSVLTNYIDFGEEVKTLVSIGDYCNVDLNEDKDIAGLVNYMQQKEKINIFSASYVEMEGSIYLLTLIPGITNVESLDEEAFSSLSRVLLHSGERLWTNKLREEDDYYGSKPY